MKGKRGNTLSNVILIGILVIFGIIGFLYANSAIKGDSSSTAAEGIVKQVMDVTIGIFNSTIGLLLGTGNLNADLAFLRIIVFILISIIIVGTFDSVNIFGEGPNSKWTNLLVGVIVAIIGVRFLPEDMWAALTAPSSAFVFAIMMGLPLVALIFIITKTRVEIVRKVMVAAYIIGLIWLFFLLDSSTYRTMALVFMVVALILLLFDRQFISYVRKERSESELAKSIDELNVLERKRLRDEVKKYNEVLLDADANEEDRESAENRLKEIKKLYGKSSF